MPPVEALVPLVAELADAEELDRIEDDEIVSMDEPDDSLLASSLAEEELAGTFTVMHPVSATAAHAARSNATSVVRADAIEFFMKAFLLVSLSRGLILPKTTSGTPRVAILSMTTSPSRRGVLRAWPDHA